MYTNCPQISNLPTKREQDPYLLLSLPGTGTSHDLLATNKEIIATQLTTNESVCHRLQDSYSSRTGNVHVLYTVAIISHTVSALEGGRGTIDE